MVDNADLQSAAPATLVAGTKIAFRSVTYSGDASAAIAPTGLVAFSGSDDAKVATDLTGDAANGLDVDVTRVSGNVTVIQGTATNLKVDASGVAVPVTDNAGSLTVDGSVTVTQGTGTNLHAVLDSGTLSTITNVVHVDDNAGSLTVDNGGTFAVQATIAAAATNIAKAEDVASADADVGVPALAVRKATPANTSGTDGDYEFLQMSAGRLWASATIDAALPAGTNAIGKLSANAGVIIGDVNIVSEIPGTGATNFGKAEDGAHTSGDTGVFILAVRNDTPSAAFSGTNGDYTPIATDSAGRVYVEQKSTTGTLTNVASSATSVNLLASNTARIAATMYNDSTQICYVKFGSTASSTSFTAALASGAYYEVPGGYTGTIDGIWVSANGNMRLTEIT